MNRDEQYCVFLTDWGYFGFSAEAGMVKRTCLPSADVAFVEQTLRTDDGELGVYDSKLMPQVQHGIKAYFLGEPVAFDEVALWDKGISPFARQVYDTLRNVSLGNTISYGGLAKMAGRSDAARAVGRAMATNPFPLIVPCHRVVAARGQLGGFTAQGGISMKKRLLCHEKAV